MPSVRRLTTVARREFSGPFDTQAFIVAAIVFTILVHVTFFLLGSRFGARVMPGFWSAGVAQLDVAYAWLPALLIGLVPALTMGAWAEERRSGTEELLLTWPVSTFELVVGKFLGRFALLTAIVAIAFVPIVVVAAKLGPLDWGVAASAGIGALLLLAACVAIGLLVSALTRDQLVAFLVGALTLGALFSAGVFARIVPGAWSELLWSISPQAHFLETGARGIVAAVDFAYATGLVVLALFANTIVVEARRWH